MGKAGFEILISENSMGCAFQCVYTIHKVYLLKQKSIYPKNRNKPSLLLEGQTRRRCLWNSFGKKTFSPEHTDLDSLKYFEILFNHWVVSVRFKTWSLDLKTSILTFSEHCQTAFNLILTWFFTCNCIFLNTDSRPQENSLPFPFHSKQAFKKYIHKNIDISEKNSKKFLRISLKHFIFCVYKICFTALVIWLALRRSARSTGLYLCVIPPDGFLQLSPSILLGCQLHPSYLPCLSPAPWGMLRRCQVETWAAAVRQKTCIFHWERSHCCPGAAATASSSSTVAFWLLEEGNSFAFLFWTNASRALPHSVFILPLLKVPISSGQFANTRHCH